MLLCINYRVIFHMNNCQPTLAPPCTETLSAQSKTQNIYEERYPKIEISNLLLKKKSLDEEHGNLKFERCSLAGFNDSTLVPHTVPGASWTLSKYLSNGPALVYSDLMWWVKKIPQKPL